MKMHRRTKKQSKLDTVQSYHIICPPHYESVTATEIAFLPDTTSNNTHYHCQSWYVKISASQQIIIVTLK
jgi:hypothetical protein